MKLDRNINEGGKGKYALIKLRDVDWELHEGKKVLARDVDLNPDCIDLGDSNDSEFFVIRLKDKYAEPALRAYAKAVHEAEGNTDWSREIKRLANKARLHENQQLPD